MVSEKRMMSRLNRKTLKRRFIVIALSNLCQLIEDNKCKKMLDNDNL